MSSVSLPHWLEEVAKESAASRVDFMPKVIQAVVIACEALRKIEIDGSGTGHWKNDGHCGACMSEISVEAQRKINDLGHE